MLNLSAILRESATARPDAPAPLYDGATMTYAGLDARSDAVAEGLVARGVAPGDRAAVHRGRRAERHRRDRATIFDGVPTMFPALLRRWTPASRHVVAKRVHSGGDAVLAQCWTPSNDRRAYSAGSRSGVSSCRSGMGDHGVLSPSPGGILSPIR